MNWIRLFIFSFLTSTAAALCAGEDTEYPAYYRVASLEASIQDLAEDVKNALEGKGFEVIGEYNPANSSDLYVLCYTRDDLADICLKFEDRGALASVLKVGLKKKDGRVDISMINPEYIFYAYLYEGIDPYIIALQGITADARKALEEVGSDFEPFGGFQDREDLEDYHYKIMMPYFTDPVELAEYNSFQEGLAVIRKNIQDRKGTTLGVYELVFEEQQVAVFGIGLIDPEDGEAEFLPVIGDDHIAAMPYEIILQGKEASMLHGRYRIALYWPERSMGNFMKIMSTPGNIEEFMEGITEE